MLVHNNQDLEILKNIKKHNLKETTLFLPNTSFSSGTPSFLNSPIAGSISVISVCGLT
jgi:hypothetical protein